MDDMNETVKAQAVEDYTPRARIIYANLCQQDKDLLTKFFIEENTIFQRLENGNYCCRIRLLPPQSQVIYADPQDSEPLIEEIVEKPAEPPKPPPVRILLPVALKGYRIFYEMVRIEENTEPRTYSLLWLIRHIEDIFDGRVQYERTFDLSEIDYIIKGEKIESDLTRFPVYVYNSMSNHYGGISSVLDQQCFYLLYNIEHYRHDHIYIELFARFLEEYYTAEDLSFFLFIRKTVQTFINKTIKQHFTGLKQINNIILSYYQCNAITIQIFKEERSHFYKSFVRILDDNYTVSRTGKRTMELFHFLFLVQNYYFCTKAPPPPSATTYYGSYSNNNNNNNSRLSQLLDDNELSPIQQEYSPRSDVDINDEDDTLFNDQMNYDSDNSGSKKTPNMSYNQRRSASANVNSNRRIDQSPQYDYNKDLKEILSGKYDYLLKKENEIQSSPIVPNNKILKLNNNNEDNNIKSNKSSLSPSDQMEFLRKQPWFKPSLVKNKPIETKRQDKEEEEEENNSDDSDDSVQPKKQPFSKYSYLYKSSGSNSQRSSTDRNSLIRNKVFDTDESSDSDKDIKTIKTTTKSVVVKNVNNKVIEEDDEDENSESEEEITKPKSTTTTTKTTTTRVINKKPIKIVKVIKKIEEKEEDDKEERESEEKDDDDDSNNGNEDMNGNKDYQQYTSSQIDSKKANSNILLRKFGSNSHKPITPLTESDNENSNRVITTKTITTTVTMNKNVKNEDEDEEESEDDNSEKEEEEEEIEQQNVKKNNLNDEEESEENGNEEEEIVKKPSKPIVRNNRTLAFLKKNQKLKQIKMQQQTIENEEESSEEESNEDDNEEKRNKKAQRVTFSPDVRTKSPETTKHIIKKEREEVEKEKEEEEEEDRKEEDKEKNNDIEKEDDEIENGKEDKEDNNDEISREEEEEDDDDKKVIVKEEVEEGEEEEEDEDEESDYDFDVKKNRNVNMNNENNKQIKNENVSDEDDGSDNSSDYDIDKKKKINNNINTEESSNNNTQSIEYSSYVEDEEESEINESKNINKYSEEEEEEDSFAMNNSKNKQNQESIETYEGEGEEENQDDDDDDEGSTLSNHNSSKNSSRRISAVDVNLLGKSPDEPSYPEINSDDSGYILINDVIISNYLSDDFLNLDFVNTDFEGKCDEDKLNEIKTQIAALVTQKIDQIFHTIIDEDNACPEKYKSLKEEYDILKKHISKNVDREIVIDKVKAYCDVLANCDEVRDLIDETVDDYLADMDD